MFENIQLPFSVGDMITTGMTILKVLGPFVLLKLAIIFAPEIIYLVKKAVSMEQLRRKHNEDYAYDKNMHLSFGDGLKYTWQESKESNFGRWDR